MALIAPVGCFRGTQGTSRLSAGGFRLFGGIDEVLHVRTEIGIHAGVHVSYRNDGNTRLSTRFRQSIAPCGAAVLEVYPPVRLFNFNGARLVLIVPVLLHLTGEEFRYFHLARLLQFISAHRPRESMRADVQFALSGHGASGGAAVPLVPPETTVGGPFGSDSGAARKIAAAGSRTRP